MSKTTICFPFAVINQLATPIAISMHRKFALQ